MTDADVPRWRLVAEPWLFGLLLGAGVGLVVLGVGGRIAMRAIALGSNTPPAFSIGGTVTVVFLGALSGVGGGLLYALLHRVVPRPRLVRSALFAIALVLLTLRGLRPIQPLALEWFMPLALGYGAIVDTVYTAWNRRRVRTPTIDEATGTQPRYSGRA
jgi:uncharacterized BrkB/YihY/UPF0761 family membrane protein